jgi:hypothetical protein
VESVHGFITSLVLLLVCYYEKGLLLRFSLFRIFPLVLIVELDVMFIKGSVGGDSRFRQVHVSRRIISLGG